MPTPTPHDPADSGPVVILGGRSEIGLEVARRLAPGRTVVLAARRADDLGAESAAVRASGATEVDCIEFDADVLESHGPLLDSLEQRHGPLRTVVLAYGILGDQATAEIDATHAAAILHTDFVAQATMLTELARRMRERRAGQIVVFSSVAGIRVRRANYVYGSAKAGLDGFASGLADSLQGSGVQLLLVRPGFVIGRMTDGMDPAPWSSTPQQVASAAVDALQKRRATVWVPGTLRWVYVAARFVPAWLWRRMPR